MKEATNTPPAGSCELVLTRDFALPAERLFKAWSDPGLLKQSKSYRTRRLVFTNPYTKAWELSEYLFMTAVITFEDLGGKSRYTARVLHWTVADREKHEAMGFHTGSNQCLDQLIELVGGN